MRELQPLDKQAPYSYLRRSILHCTRDPIMFRLLANWIERLFAPAFQLLGDLPPSALNRLFAPF